MINLIETIGMEKLADRSGIPWQGRNFEDFYADLHTDSSKTSVRLEVEDFVFRYFAALELPEEPTIYDYLILSLRPKDVIATFNWDPFLYWAYMRNAKVCDPPQFLYLHGNTALLYRFKPDGMLQCAPRHPSQIVPPTGWKATPLLYPVRKKDYQTDPLTKKHWEWASEAMGRSFLFTVFGYSAPASDVEAVKLLKAGWGDTHKRQFEEIEIIDRPGMPEDDLRKRWKKFIHTHHYQVHSSFFDSMIAQMPRRSVEGMWTMLIEARFLDPNPVPPLGTVTLDELQAWYRPLVAAEKPRIARP
jgi:hypothetical protein